MKAKAKNIQALKTKTTFEVHVTLGTMPSLLPRTLGHVEKFSTEKRARIWAEKFKGFLALHKYTKKYTEIPEDEISFLGGNHYAISYDGMKKISVTNID